MGWLQHHGGAVRLEEPSRSRRAFVSEPATLAEADVAALTDDDVVEHVHAEHPARIHEPTRQDYVIPAIWNGYEETLRPV